MMLASLPGRFHLGALATHEEVRRIAFGPAPTRQRAVYVFGLREEPELSPQALLRLRARKLPRREKRLPLLDGRQDTRPGASPIAGAARDVQSEDGERVDEIRLGAEERRRGADGIVASEDEACGRMPDDLAPRGAASDRCRSDLTERDDQRRESTT
jgi:hypothetical protein